MIDLYAAATPNGRKIVIALEEMALPYRLKRLNLSEGEQKTPEFLALNPNGKIPVIIDHDAQDMVLSESGAILLYLASKSGMLMPADEKQYFVAMQWLMFQMSAIGPFMGQSAFFNNSAKEKVPLAIKRFNTEAMRIMAVLDGRLEQVDYVAGDYSIVDIAIFPWIAASSKIGLDIAGFSNLKRWLDVVGSRAAVQEGMKVLA